MFLSPLHPNQQQQRRRRRQQQQQQQRLLPTTIRRIEIVEFVVVVVVVVTAATLVALVVVFLLIVDNVATPVVLPTTTMMVSSMLLIRPNVAVQLRTKASSSSSSSSSTTTLRRRRTQQILLFQPTSTCPTSLSCFSRTYHTTTSYPAYLPNQLQRLTTTIAMTNGNGNIQQQNCHYFNNNNNNNPVHYYYRTTTSTQLQSASPSDLYPQQDHHQQPTAFTAAAATVQQQQQQQSYLLDEEQHQYSLVAFTSSSNDNNSIVHEDTIENNDDDPVLCTTTATATTTTMASTATIPAFVVTPESSSSPQQQEGISLLSSTTTEEIPATNTFVKKKATTTKKATASTTAKTATSISNSKKARAATASSSYAYYDDTDSYGSYSMDDDYDDNNSYNDYQYDDRSSSSSSSSSKVPLVDPNAPKPSTSAGVITYREDGEPIYPPNRWEYEAARYPPVEIVKSVYDYNSLEEYFTNENIRSRPVENGNWNVEEPLQWAKDFGRRSPEYDMILQSIIQLRPGDEGYYDVSDITVPDVTIVRTKEQAQIVMKQLMNADTNIIHACDTEVMDIDLKSVGPVGNGYCTCISIYSGPNFDYGLGQGLGTTLWIDNLDDSCGLIQEFKLWFESEQYKKVWHNYGFDRHILWNEGIDLRGFWGDTMHMARLEDSSRAKTAGAGGYGLEALTADILKDRKQPMKELFGVKRLRKDGSEGTLVDIPPVEVLQRDPKFRSNWIEYSAKDAKSTWLLREELRKRLQQKSWIKPDVHMYDYYELHMRPFGEVLTDMERRGIRVDANEYLASVEIQARHDRAHHVEVFRQWAGKQIGANGLAMNTASATQLCTFLFGGANNVKTNEATPTVREFKVPRDEIPEDALQAYAMEEEAASKKENELQEASKPMFDVEAALKKMKVAELKLLCKEKNLPISGKKADLIIRLLEQADNVETSDESNNKENATAKDDLDEMSLADLQDFAKSRGVPHIGTREQVLERLRQDIQMTKELQEDGQPNGRDSCIALSQLLEMRAREAASNAIVTVPKFVTVKISSIGLQPEKYTVGGAPSVTADVIRKLAGDPFADPPKYGTAFERVGKEGCEALFSLCAIGSIDTMIANFLTSLQELSDHQSRVHCSLNLNTETGRLSSRRPNLQNQPALEKDKYKIRKAFQASPGNNLIVADYGQLELRVLASVTDCKSMINAFAAGGDFHSRTALDMFDYIQKALDNGECLLEWDYSQGKPPKPLLKDMFASERRKAKTLNFSIAYGKTAHGLSQDWGVPIAEAEEMLEAWYKARPEVREWQVNSKRYAEKNGTTRTIMGRYRNLPMDEIVDNEVVKKLPRKVFGQAQRASINTPIQGGAADIAMMAMNKINNSVKLKRLGWILLLQIHDEVILEGPEETSEEAFEEVLQCMEEPWCYGLKKTVVPLVVDGSHKHKTWYDAK